MTISSKAWVGLTNLSDTTTILIVTLLITTSLTMTLLIRLNTGDITYDFPNNNFTCNDITYNT